MSQRFFADRAITGDSAQLTGAEAHHLIHVMRASVGERIVVFDGSGAEFSAEVTNLGRSTVELRVLAREEVNRELPFDLTLGVALPKGDRQRWLVEKATELGVTRLVPLETARGVAQPNSRTLDRLRRTVIEASKQCGRNRLMDIGTPQRIDEYVAHPPATAGRLIADPSGAVALPKRETAAPSYLAIGPEGGFTPQELSEALDKGWQAVHLGPRILRIETAALLVAAQVIGNS